jgi:hypothetical protein
MPVITRWLKGSAARHMHVIGHDHPGGVSHYTCYSVVPQPSRPESGFIRFAVKGEKKPGRQIKLELWLWGRRFRLPTAQLEFAARNRPTAK